MEYTNDERIKIYKSIFELFKKNNIIEDKIPPNYIDGIAHARVKKMIIVEAATGDDYLLTFWDKYKNNYLLFFPTPPYDKEKIDDKLDSFVTDTRKIIDDLMKHKPKKIILDLRCNNGGFIHVFYNALYPILPKFDGLILSGVDLNGKEIMRLEDNNNSLDLSIKDPVNGDVCIKTPIINPIKHNVKVEVWVNARTASSAEMIMIMFAQRGFKVKGEPTMGLTSGMLTQIYDNYNVHIPYYWFKDLNGKIYNQTVRPKPLNKVSQPAMLIEGNVVAKVPEKIIKGIKPSTPSSTFNHIHCKYLGENSHFGIDHDLKNPEPVILNNDRCLYIYIPENSKVPLLTILNKYSKEVFNNKPIIIDIRNSKLRGDDAIEMFACLYKPHEIPLKETKNDVENKGSFYISGSHPYLTIYRSHVISKYASINAKIWFNKNSIYGDCKSVLLLKHLIWSFGIIEGSTYGNFFDYSMHKYLVRPFNVYIYTCRY